MPTVKFPYTQEGIEAAQKVANEYGAELIMDDEEGQQESTEQEPTDIAQAMDY